ncbi:myophilin-like isoform X1 [Panonychus citri]|uniref:myophilin-like isoform X1 n=1 Tax=Panonychus citri TaxID=50023 RepID=UPI0023077A59|nr:myophilin-like isoform X1 [Panonychus citri]XP_053212569.1 myophilin-like isoform X1 [Panonychus citri]
MANRVGPRGITFLGAEKHIREGKRDKFAESEIGLWIEAVLEDCIPPKPFEELFKDGVLLCRAMNVLRPGSISKIQKPFTKDAHMANLNAFLDACRSFGIPADELFAPEDLWEAKNIPKVVLTMLSIGKKLYDSGWEGASLGPKPTGEIKDWPEQVLRASEAIIPAQYGTNKFANQKGVRIGGARDITPKVSDKTNKENMKEWSEQQLRASESIIPAQYGTNKFATQKGYRIGASRDIMPKVSDTSNRENWRQWSDEQLRASEAIVPLQYGTNKLASQKGIRFGGARDILPNVQYKSTDKPEE